MTPTQLSELQTAVTEAIRTCNDAISKLCQIESILKDIRFKPLIEQIGIGEPKSTPTTSTTSTTFTPEKKKTGNPLAELVHNIQKLTPEQSWNLIQKLSSDTKSSHPETLDSTLATDTKQDT